MFRKPKSVDAVLSAFTKTLQELADVADSKRAEAAVHDDEMDNLRDQLAERQKAKAEALQEQQRALSARDRISDLIGAV